MVSAFRAHDATTLTALAAPQLHAFSATLLVAPHSLHRHGRPPFLDKRPLAATAAAFFGDVWLPA
jgi:hypothetical protein